MFIIIFLVRAFCSPCTHSILHFSTIFLFRKHIFFHSRLAHKFIFHTTLVLCSKINAHSTHTLAPGAAAAAAAAVDRRWLVKTRKRKRKKRERKKINVQSTRVLGTQSLRSFIISVAVYRSAQLKSRRKKEWKEQVSARHEEDARRRKIRRKKVLLQPRAEKYVQLYYYYHYTHHHYIVARVSTHFHMAEGRQKQEDEESEKTLRRRPYQLISSVLSASFSFFCSSIPTFIGWNFRDALMHHERMLGTVLLWSWTTTNYYALCTIFKGKTEKENERSSLSFFANLAPLTFGLQPMFIIARVHAHVFGAFALHLFSGQANLSPFSSPPLLAFNLHCVDFESSSSVSSMWCTAHISWWWRVVSLSINLQIMIINASELYYQMVLVCAQFRCFVSRIWAQDRIKRTVEGSSQTTKMIIAALLNISINNKQYNKKKCICI